MTHDGDRAITPPRPPFPPAAVVFDLDGLLVDSEDAWGEAERRLVLSYGRPWDPAVRTLLLGRGAVDVARILAEYLGVDDRREIDRRLLQATVSEFNRGISARPGARRLLEALTGRLPLVAATNSRRVLAELSVSSAGLTPYLQELVCAEDVAAPKPAPDPYLAACRALGVDPSRTVGFEDSPLGATSAKAAGLWVVGCPSFPGTVLEAADVVVASLADVDPDALVGGVASG